MSRMRWIVMAMLVPMLSDCAATQAVTCRSGEHAEVSDTLYFGTGTPTGVVSPEQWARFLAMTVTPRFPQGLSVMDAQGQWRGASGVIGAESSRILNVVHVSDASSETAVTDIMSAYKVQFRQEAVLRVKTNACVSF